MSEADEKKPHEMKVTDRRIFTPDGELREEYRGLADAPAAAAETPGRQAPPPEPPPPQPPPQPFAAWPESPAAGAPGPAGGERGAPLELPGTPPGLGPAFFDLVAVLAEPVPLYLGDAPLPDGQSAENMEAARFHIDLLDVLRQKTAGNLSAQESAVLEDILYRLRMRFVQKRG
jgi:hypothetical protein